MGGERKKEREREKERERKILLNESMIFRNLMLIGLFFS